MTRLADGAAAALNTETYVAACRALGVGGAGLSAAMVRDLWGAEDGLSLAALDTDSAALQNAADAAEDGLRAQREALALLSEAWRGSAGPVALERVAGHCADSEAAVTALRDAASALGSLRDQLGELLAAKADAAVRIDGRAGLLADAAAVVDGTADGSAAEAVRQRIAPYVDADVRAEWVSAMRTATESVAAAYEQSAAKLLEHTAPVGTAPVGTAPVGAAPSGPEGAGQPSTLPSAGPAGAGPPVSVPDLSGLLPPVPDVGAPLATLVAHIAEALGGADGAEALGGADGAEALGGADGAEAPGGDGESGPPESEGDGGKSAARTHDPGGQETAASAAMPAVSQPAAAAGLPPADPAPATADPAPAARPEPAPAAEPDAGQTPCAIAADALPQAGP